MAQKPFLAELTKRSISQPIDLFKVDLTAILPTDTTAQKIYYFCNWTTTNGQDVVYKTITYTAIPLESSGFETGGSQQLARPTITLANVGLGITSLINTHGDLVGATVERLRTLTCYLDGADKADPDAYFGPDIYVVEQRVREDKIMTTWQLAVPFDLEGQTLPARRLLREQCQWTYKSATGCGYTGTSYWDVNDTSVTDSAKDVCGKRLASCKLRFGSATRLPFGGFPGLVDRQG
jgi:lambda family phage minor tail protein L